MGTDGLAAEFTAVDERGPAVLVFSGSGGGPPGREYLPALHAAGFSVLALTYFGAPGLPDVLHEIPLEYFERALTWLRGHPRVDASRVFVMSRSRGTEAAQLLALRQPDKIAGLVLGAPSYVVVQAWPASGAAWTLNGNEVAYHPGGWPTGPFPSAPPALIPLDEYEGPVLLVSGGQDQIWPSADFAAVITSSRDSAGRLTEHWSYPDAGHAVGTLLNLDGTSTDPADVDARDDAWPRVVSFLKRQSTHAHP